MFTDSPIVIETFKSKEGLKEFIRFLDDRVKLNKQYPDLYNRFEKLNYDDIRMPFDFDNEILKELNIR